MDKGLIPRRYAKALFEVALERKDSEKLYEIMQVLASAFTSNPALADTLANPFVADSDKASLLLNVVYGADTDGADATYSDFVKLLVRNKRVDMARAIAIAYISLYRKENSIYRVAIASAAPLGAPEKKRLEAIIAAHLGKGTMEYEYSVDPSLIGGFTVTVNSERLDASVSNQLKRLRLSLVN